MYINLKLNIDVYGFNVRHVQYQLNLFMDNLQKAEQPVTQRHSVIFSVKIKHLAMAKT